MRDFRLHHLPVDLKTALQCLTVTLIIGVIVGLIFLGSRVGNQPSDIVSHYNGNEQFQKDEFEISYGKSFNEITLTVHNHIISFALIFAFITIMFFGVSMKSARFKRFLLIEPYVSIVTTFGSMYLIRYVDERFVYLMILSSFFMYASFFIMSYFILRELRRSV